MWSGGCTFCQAHLDLSVSRIPRTWHLKLGLDCHPQDTAGNAAASQAIVQGLGKGFALVLCEVIAQEIYMS